MSVFKINVQPHNIAQQAAADECVFANLMLKLAECMQEEDDPSFIGLRDYLTAADLAIVRRFASHVITHIDQPTKEESDD